MSLHAILEVIRASGAQEVRKIEADANTQAREILANARLEADRIRKESRDAVVTPVFKERARIIHRARLKALQISGDVRESFVDASLEQTRGHLAGIRTDTSYPHILRSLLLESLKELSGSLEISGTAQLEADPRDKKLLEQFIFDLGLVVTPSYPLNCWGGLIAKSEDGRIVAINTIEARFKRATPYLRRLLAALFEDQLTPLDFRQIENGVAETVW